MIKKIGIIGTGNMGSAIIKGIASSEYADSIYINIYDIDSDQVNRLVKTSDRINAEKSCSSLVCNSDMIILAVKPAVYSAVLDEIKDSVDSSRILVIIAAGMSISFVESFFSFPVKVVRTMPNTPLLVKTGMTALCGGSNASEDDIKEVEKIFSCLGLTEIIEEKYFDQFTALAGSSPAYIYMIIEAMADGGVLEGFPRKAAYKAAAQAVKGAAEMVLSSGLHPGELKDMVCSPGGTTIEAVAVLEKEGVRNSFIQAVRECSEKSRKMKK